ncbi:MAG TPA: hypothetical protein VF490_14670 [Chryseosolibacter sp.]
MKTVLVLLLMCAGLPRLLVAQDYIPIFSRDYSSRLSVEVDPIAFLYDGLSLNVRYQPMFSDRFLIGVSGYCLDLPQQIVDFNPENRDEGWAVRIRSAYMLHGELYAKTANNGWFIGEQIGFQSFRVSNSHEFTASAKFNNLLLMTYAGYTWHPAKGAFYFKPWIGVGYTEKVDGVNTAGKLKYNIAPLFPYMTINAGYTF